MSLIVGSAHQMPLVRNIPFPSSSLILTQFLAFIIRNLCLYPEYIKPLLSEIDEFAENNHDDRDAEMPHLDSFLKETARLNPVTVSKTSPSISTWSNNLTWDGLH